MARFSVETVFKAIDRMTAPISRMQNRVNRFTRGMTRSVRAMSDGWGRLQAKISKTARAVAAGTAMMAVATAGLAQSGLDFEQAITNVGAVSLQTRAQIAPLEAQAKQLGATTKFTATEAANAMEILARAGFNTQQIMQAVPAVLSAAAASGLEIAEVSDHVSNVLKGMGLEMNQAARVADVLALASSKTNSSIGSLGESMRNVSATARELGIPLEQAVASVALLQDVGLDASVAGSAVNTMLTQMAAPSAGMQKRMRKLGLSFKDANGDMVALTEVLRRLATASNKVGGNFDKVAFLAELVGLRGQKAASNLAALFETGKYEELVKSLGNAAGAADKMANIRMDTTLGSLTLLGSAIDAVKVQIFDTESGPLKNLIDRMTAWINANQNLIATRVVEYIDRFVEALPEIVKWAERIGKTLVVFYAFGLALKTIATILTVINLLAIANPIGLIVAGIAASIAVIASAIIWWDELKSMFGSLPEPVRVALKAIAGPIFWFINAAKMVYDSWEPIGNFFIQLWAKIARVGDALSSVKGAAEWAGSLFSSGGRAAVDRRGRPTGGRQMVSPQDRTARTIEEQRTTSTAEVTIRDDTGRAAVTSGTLGAGVQLQQSGAFQ